MTETELQKQCNEYLTTRGIHFFHLQKGRGNAQQYIQCAGLPDTLIWYHGRHCLIELKTETGTLNTAQKREFPKFDNAGFPVQVVRSLDEFITAVNVFLGEA